MCYVFLLFSIHFFRFVCVCIPLRHGELTNRRIIICMVCMYFGSIAANWGTPVIGKQPRQNNNILFMSIVML